MRQQYSDQSGLEKKVGSEERDAALVNLVLTRRQNSLDAMNDRRQSWLDNYAAYLAQREDPLYDWQSNLVLPVVFDAVESILPHIIQEDLQFHVSAQYGADPENAFMLDGLLMNATKKMDFSWKALMAAKQMLIYGTSPLMTSYMLDEKMMKVREPQEVFSGTPFAFSIPKTKEQMVTRYEGPWLEVPDIATVMPQPGRDRVNGPNGYGMDWLVHWFCLPWNALEAMAESGVISKTKLKKIRETDPTQFSEEWQDIEDRRNRIGIDEFRWDETMRPVEVLAMWGHRGDGMAPGLVWLVNRSVILRDEANPYFHGDIPFDFITDVPQHNSVYGLGEADILQVYQDEKSDLRNTRMDNLHQITNRMWTRIRGSGIDPNQMRSRPNGIIDLQSHGDIQQVLFSDVPVSLYNEEPILQEDIERTAGQLDVLRGQRLGGDRASARESQLIADFAAARVKVKLMSLKRGLSKVGRWSVQLLQQFPSNREIRVSRYGQQMDITVTPEMIAGEWEVDTALEQALPMTRMQKKQDALDLSQAVGPFIGELVNPEPILMAIFKAFNVENPESYLAQQQAAQQGQADPEAMAQEAVAAAMGQEGGMEAAPPQGAPAAPPAAAPVAPQGEEAPPQ